MLRVPLALLCAAIVAATGARRAFLLVTVRGDSMEPSLQDGDRLLVARRPSRLQPRRGWVVVGPLGRVLRAAGFSEGDWRQVDETLFVKRIVAGPGDVTPTRTPGESKGDRLRGGEWFVWGDNPASADSTQWGPVAADAITGVALFRLRAAHTGPQPSALHLPPLRVSYRAGERQADSG